MLAIHERYILKKEIGQGGMGHVYHALDRLNNTEVALKRVDVEKIGLEALASTESDEIRAGLAQEFRLLSALHHPNIIRVMDFGVDEENRPYYTMQLLHNPIPITTAAHSLAMPDRLGLMVQTLHALHYLHQRGILHRDVKPSNLVVEDGHVYVLDFGLAIQKMRTQSQAGTLLYLAPEALLGGDITAASDIYALGVLFYEILSGSLPYAVSSHSSRKDIISAILEKSPNMDNVDLSQCDITPQQAEGLLDIIGGMLNKNPNQRLGNARDILLRLAALFDIDLNTRPDTLLQMVEFVGREEELGRLTAALDHVQTALSDIWAFVKQSDSQRVGQAFLIGGESGVGKSRLIRETHVHALTHGCLVLKGSSTEENAAYELWRKPLRRLVLSLELSDFEVAVLQALVPDIDCLCARKIIDIPRLSPAAAHERLKNTVLTCFRRLEVPTLLILEDLHWAEESLDLLHTLTLHLPKMPLVIVGSYRVDETPQLPERLPQMESIVLKRFERTETNRLIEAILGNTATLTPDFVSWLHTQTEGNVFFALETLRVLIEDNMQRLPQIMQTENILPQGIRPIIERRLAKVPAWGLTLLEMTAIAGRQLHVPLLRALHDDDDSYTLNEWLMACANASVIEFEGNVWQFTHDRLRQGILERVAHDRALITHVAKTKEIIVGHDPKHALAMMALWQLAGDTPREYSYAVLAAHFARQNFDFHGAADLLEHALNIMPTQNCDVMLGYADTLYEIGDLGGAKQIINQSLNYAQNTSDLNCTAGTFYRMARLALLEHDYENTVYYAENCLSLFRDLRNDHYVAHTLVLLGRAYSEMASSRTAQEYLRRAIEIFRSKNDSSGEVNTLLMLGSDAYLQEDNPRALEHLHAALKLARAIGDQLQEATVIIALGSTLHSQGRTLNAISQLSNGLEMAQRLSITTLMMQAEVKLGHCFISLGDVANAVQYYQNALQHSRRISNQSHIAFECVLGYARYCLHQGQPDRAARLVGMVYSYVGINAEVQLLAEQLRHELRNSLTSFELLSFLKMGEDASLEESLAELKNLG